MKSANGFFDGKCYIRWNLSSVGEKDLQYPRRKFVVRNARSFDIALQRRNVETELFFLPQHSLFDECIVPRHLFCRTLRLCIFASLR
jgi:hypothetical protein